MTETTDLLTTGTPNSRRKRKWPVAWLVIIALLLIGWMTTFFMGKSAISKLEKSHNTMERQQIMAKGTMLAASLKHTDPVILANDGQNYAQSFFSEIMQDMDIVFIAVLDNNGEVHATSDIRLKRQAVRKVSDMGNKVISSKGSSGADREFVGALNNAYGKQIGAVLVGVSYSKDAKKKK